MNAQMDKHLAATAEGFDVFMGTGKKTNQNKPQLPASTTTATTKTTENSILYSFYTQHFMLYILINSRYSKTASSHRTYSSPPIKTNT